MDFKRGYYRVGYRINTDTPAGPARDAAVAKFMKLLPNRTEAVMIFMESGLFLFMTCDRYDLTQRTDWTILYTERYCKDVLIGVGMHDVPGLGCTVWRTRAEYIANIMEQALLDRNPIKSYYPDTYRFQDKASTGGFPYYYLYDYYPHKRYDYDQLDANQRLTSTLVTHFKEGRRPARLHISTILKAAMLREPFLRYDLLTVIPASTQQKNRKRFEAFCQQFAELGKNGFDAIRIIHDREEMKGQSGCDKTANLAFDHEKIAGKRILLLDDVITRGDGFRQAAEKLMDNGATSVTGLFLARTVTPNILRAQNR